MGATNVAKVFTHWRHLSHREARALAFMANMALDADRPPRYFGGWQAVALALGLEDAASARRMTMQVFAALREAGATVSSGQARMNVRAEYALTLEPEFTFEPRGTGRSIAWVQVPRTTVRVHEKDTHQGVPEVQNRVHEKDTPRSKEEPQRGVLEEKTGGVQITNHSDLTNAGALEIEAPVERPSLEDERSRQLAALEQRITEQKKAS